MNSASVFSAAAGEGEQYLFYRGVAHLDALLRTAVTRGHGQAERADAATWLERP